MIRTRNSLTPHLSAAGTPAPAAANAASPTAAPAPPEDRVHFTDDERKQLKDWGSHLKRNGNGVLETPMVGHVNSEMHRAQQFVSHMVERLGGDDLRKNGIRLFVNLYSSEDINACAVGNPGIDKNQTVIRRLLKVEDGKPFYEMAINLGTLHKLKTQDELAFVLSHELSHVFEHHVDPTVKMGQSSKWLEGQGQEAMADVKGVDRMVKAGYNPEGALSFMTLISEDDTPPTDANQALVALAGTLESHHDQGVRIAMLQGEIERLRRIDPKARDTGKPQVPMPSFVKATATQRTGSDEMRMGEVQQHLTDLLPLALSPKPQSWVHPNNLTDFFHPCADPAPVQALRYTYSPSRAQLGHLLATMTDLIDNSDGDAQSRMDAFWRYAQFVPATVGAHSYDGPSYSPADQAKIGAFLHKNARAGWKADGLLAKLSVDHDKDPGTRGFVMQTLLNPGMQQILAPLAQSQPEVGKLVDSVPTLLARNLTDGKPNDMGYVASLVQRLGAPEHNDDTKTVGGALDERLKAGVLRFLETADLASSVAVVDPTLQFSGFDGIAYPLYSPDYKPTDKAFIDKVRVKFDPFVPQFLKFRAEHALHWLDSAGKPPVPDDPDPPHPHQYGEMLRDLYRTRTMFPFSPTFQDRLAHSVANFARAANRDPAYLGERGFTLFSTLPGLGTGLADMLSNPKLSADEKKEVAQLILSNVQTGESLPASGERSKIGHKVATYLAGLPAEERLAMISKPAARSSFQQTLSADLGYLTLQGPVPLDNDSLAALGKRADNNEFRFHKTKKDPGYDEDLKRMEPLIGEEAMRRHEEVSAITQLEANRQLAPLTFLGTDRAISRQVADSTDWGDLKSMTRTVQDLQGRQALIRKIDRTARPTPVSTDGNVFLLDSLMQAQSQAKDLNDWYQVADRIINFNPAAIEGRSDYRQRLQDFLLPRLEALKPPELREWLGKPHILDGLDATSQALLLGKLVDPALPPDQIGAAVSKLDEEYNLADNHREGFSLFQDQLAERARLQPGDAARVFPARDLKLTDADGGLIRGLSGLVGLARTQSVPNQIEMIDYLMGRKQDMPEFLSDVTRQARSAVPLTQMVADARAELTHADIPTRVLVADSFLAGPNAFIRKPEGMKAITDHLLTDVPPEHQQLAHRLAAALLESQGSSDSLALAYVMGQRPDPNGKMSEASVLNNLFDAYGVPGVKFKQYLAFTSEFKDFRSAFEESQDNANPLSYRQVIELINDRFQGKWPRGLKIDRILGSGSVNIGVRYYNPETRRKEVLAIARKDVETSTDYDFQRFHNFLVALNKTPEDREKFGYLLGLSNIIHDSVSLEFDKQAAYAMQKQVQSLYHRDVNGWHIRTIDAFKQEDMGLFMEEAKGVTARKLRASDPACYKAAMKAMSAVEMDSLLGIDERGKPKPVPLHANPDFHDGQVLIDPATRTATILDFGQAVPISNQQRNYAIDMLRVIARAQNPAHSLKILQKYDPKMTCDALEPILDRSERMDIFVRLISKMDEHGTKLPISVVHWIMAVNRQLALGAKIGVNTEAMVRNLLLVTRLGGSLTTYNRVHLAGEAAHQVMHSLLAGPAGPAVAQATSNA